jgi:hypothetical protein
MFLIVLVLAVVNSAVFPAVNAQAFHVVLPPFALVGSAVKPLVDAEAEYLVFVPISGEDGAVVPFILAEAMLTAIAIDTFISAAILPSL